MRCFVAVELPAEVKRALAAVINGAKSIGLDASFAKPEQLHCTLVFLGEKSEEEVNQIIEALKQVTAGRFTVVARGLGFFPSESFARVFWVGLESRELLELQKRVGQALNSVDTKPFKSHVTLARIKSKKNLSQLLAYAHQNNELVFGEFEASEFILKKSTLTPQGAVYEDVARFALV